VLSLQTLSHALIFAAQNASGLAERALLAPDTAATAALGRSWAAFCLLHTFTTNVVSVCPLVVGRCAGDGNDGRARVAAGQALFLACGGGALGLVLAAVAGGVAACADGPARGVALFLATQGLALGPQLGARALVGYFAGTMRVGPRLLVAVGLIPAAVHLVLAWLLTGLLSWSVAGAGLARLGAALAAAAAALTVARVEFGGFGGTVGRPNRALLRAMLAEGSVLGLQQVLAGLMVLLLYVTAARAGDVTSAALTLTHSGVYPLLFCLAWGSSQAVGAAAARAVGCGDSRELARVTRLGLGLSVLLAFALPWGAFAVCGRPILTWLVGGGAAGGAVLAASERLMGLLAVFFVFDLAINFLSALLRAAKEQAYLLKATAAAAGFGLFLSALPLRPDDAGLMGTFIAGQAAWAVLLLYRVCRRWPGAVSKPGPAALGPWSLAGAARMGGPHKVRPRSEPRPPAPVNLHPLTRPRCPTPEEFAMNPLLHNTAPLPPALRALALGLLIETGVAILGGSQDATPVPPGPDEGGADGDGSLWQALRHKCGELSALVLRADDPGEAAAFVLGYLPKHFEHVFEQLFGQKRRPVLNGFGARCQLAVGGEARETHSA
jgi:Na+-driven multidrug efflux pump